MSGGRENTDLGFWNKKKSEKNVLKTAAAYLNKTGSLERRLGRSSDQTQKTLARAKKNSLEPRTRSFRSATRRTLERRNARSSEEQTSSLERRRSRSSQETQLSGLYLNAAARSSEETLARATDQKQRARSSDELLARAKGQNSGQQPFAPKHCQPVTDLPKASHNSEIRN